jgi:glutaredoxin
MHYARTSIAGLVLALLAGPACAVTVFQCEDSQGNRTFERACPPGTKVVQEKDYQSSGEAPAPAEDLGPAPDLPPITVYLVPDCESCTQMKEFLDFRQIPYTTKDVKDNLDLQVELKTRSGDLRAPTVLVGEKAVVGFNRTALLGALQESGYIEAPAPEAAPAPPAEQPPAAAEAAAAAEQ